MVFRAGAAEAVITPPVGTLLEGYGGRSGGAVGVHDDLHARAVVFSDGNATAAVVGCDLVGIDRRLARTVREIVFDGAGIPQSNVMVAATHTHAGPAGLRADADAALMDVTARTIAGAVIAAHADMRPAVLKVGRGAVDSVSQNRRDPEGPADDRLDVLLFDSPGTGEPPIASIVNFACHATVLYRTNMHISADYAGHAVRTVQGVLGDAPCVFLNGACADVNPAWAEQSHSEAARVGSIVGSEAARRLQELRPLGGPHRAWNIRWDELTDRAITSGALITDPRITVRSTPVEVPLRKLDAPEEYAARIETLQRERDALPADDVAGRRRIMARLTKLAGDLGVAQRLRDDGSPHSLHPEVQAIGLGGGTAILGLPGEFFAETGMAIRAAAGLPHLMISCYTNHHVFYVVPARSWAEGGYEPGVSWLDETADERFRAAAVALLEGLER